MEEEIEYILRFDDYKNISWELMVYWPTGIDICLQLTERFENKWTRHPSIKGPSRPYGQYWDLYNEGAIILIERENIKQLSKLK